MAKKAAAKTDSKTAILGFEAKLWQLAGRLRNNMDAAEYKHVVLKLTLLKYISNTYRERPNKLLPEFGEGANPEEPDDCRTENDFLMLTRARWYTPGDDSMSPTNGNLSEEVTNGGQYVTPRYRPLCCWRRSHLAMGESTILIADAGRKSVPSML